MKKTGAVVWIGWMLIAYSMCYIGGCKKYTYDSQVAEGEWKIEIQTPPCVSQGHMQVIWPKDIDGPVVITCSSMPVGEK